MAKNKEAADEAKEARVNFMAEPTWLRQVEKAAKQLGLSLSAYIRVAINEKMKRQAREDSPHSNA